MPQSFTPAGVFPATAQGLNGVGEGMLPGLLGVEVTSVEDGTIAGRIVLKRHHLAPNGFLHAATVIGLADTLCGYGCMLARPPGVTGFTTIELKTNFLRTLTDGVIAATATLLHGGRTTQIWDAEAVDESTGGRLAAFRCTQLLLRA